MWSPYRFHPTVYAAYQPTCANEFPNDNPALHRGARWVCRGPLGAPRALLQTPAGPLSRSQPASEALPGQAPELAPPAEPAAPVSTASLEVASLEVEPERARVELAARLAGPLQLDLTRIVLPHRVANIPPPPEFVFRPFRSSQRRSAEAAAPPLPLLGYRVVDAQAGAHRVERRWRVDRAPCLGVDDERRAVQPLDSALSGGAAEVSATSAVSSVAELEALAQVLFPDLPVFAESAILKPVEPPGGEPPVLELSDLVAQQLSPASEVRPSENDKKKQRRRAARVASSASLVAAALPGNAELSRTLSEIENQFAERRSKPARNRRQRRAAPAAPTPSEAPPRRASNAV